MIVYRRSLFRETVRTEVYWTYYSSGGDDYAPNYRFIYGMQEDRLEIRIDGLAFASFYYLVIEYLLLPQPIPGREMHQAMETERMILNLLSDNCKTLEKANYFKLFLLRIAWRKQRLRISRGSTHQ